MTYCDRELKQSLQQQKRDGEKYHPGEIQRRQDKMLLFSQPVQATVSIAMHFCSFIASYFLKGAVT